MGTQEWEPPNLKPWPTDLEGRAHTPRSMSVFFFFKCSKIRRCREPWERRGSGLEWFYCWQLINCHFKTQVKRPLLLIMPNQMKHFRQTALAGAAGPRGGGDDLTEGVRLGTAFLLLPTLPTHANAPLSFSRAPRGTSWALRRAKKSSLLLGMWPSEGTGRNRQGGGPVTTWSHWTKPHTGQHWGST